MLKGERKGGRAGERETQEQILLLKEKALKEMVTCDRAEVASRPCASLLWDERLSRLNQEPSVSKP